MPLSCQCLNNEDLDGRLNCFGDFDKKDFVCLNKCALSINCAIAKNKFLNFQLLEDSPLPFSRFDFFEAE